MAALRPKRRAFGFSTLELLVATALAGILLVGAITVLTNWRSSSSAVDRSFLVEENGHRALKELGDAVRAAGFGGCTRNPLSAGSTVRVAANPRWDFSSAAVRGYDGGGDSNPPLDALVAGALEGSDVLVVQKPRDRAAPMYLESRMQTRHDALRVRSDAIANLQPGDVAMIASCEARAYFVASAVSDKIISHSVTPEQRALTNVTDELHYAFGAGAEILPIDTTIYYVGMDPDSHLPSLLRREGFAQPATVATLAANATDLQLEFGIDENWDGSVDGYRSASDVQNWSDVLTVSIALKLRAPPSSEAASAPAPAVAPNADSVGDREFRSVIAIRNRTDEST